MRRRERQQGGEISRHSERKRKRQSVREGVRQIKRVAVEGEGTVRRDGDRESVRG